jgi:ligand-binding sensor domain-containing protein/two-component sensor histidine kinase
MRKTLSYLFVITTLFCYVTSKAQQFNFKNYSVEDGLAQSQVFSMIEDHRGNLWMGTRGGGISCFDGLKFKTYTTKDGLSNNYIYCLFQDHNKIIWIGTNHGLSSYDGLGFKNYFPEGDSVEISIHAILQDHENKLWLATNNGLYTFNGKTFFRFSEKHNFFSGSIACLYLDNQNNIWLGGDKGLGKINSKGETKLFTKKDGFSNIAVRAIYKDSTNNLWIGSYGSGLVLFDGKKSIEIDKNNDLNGMIILDVEAGKNGNIWIATFSDGVYEWNRTDSTFSCFNENDGLSNNHVRHILKDSWGNFWFATSGGGVSKYSGQQFDHFDKSTGLPGNFIYSIYQDKKGRLWMGCSDKGICIYDGPVFKPLFQDSTQITGRVKAICEDKDSVIWFGIDGIGLMNYDGIKVNHFTDINGKYIRDIITDSTGNIWAATLGNGLYKISTINSGNKKYSTKRFFSNKEPSKNRINCLLIDSLQRLWIGYDNAGIGYMRNEDSIICLDENDGLVGNAIRSMAEDQSGFLWIGTAGAGLSRLAIYSPDFNFTNYNTLTSNNIYLSVFDKDDNLFAGSESGIDKLTLNKDRNLIELKHYGKAEGFIGIETCQNAACLDANGNLWFGTINGLSRFNPKNILHNMQPPILSINEIKLNYEPLKNTKHALFLSPWNQLNHKLLLEHNENRISFDFIGINLSNPEKVLYRWKLENIDDDWSPPTTQNNASYANLPPGNYSFLIKACNEDYVWSNEQKIAFSILPPFWKNWWFLAGVIISGLILMFLIFKWRLNTVKRKAENIRKELEIEKNMLELEQKTLRLQMNPHFIFNALNSIQALISQKDEKTARYYLAKFSKLMRMILENSRNTYISLEDEIKTLEMYASLEQFSSGNTFDFSIEVPKDIDIMEINIPPMLIQPFIENAIIHGIRHLEKRGKITVSFKLNKKVLECMITDNGIGRKKAASIKSQEDQKHKSTALMVTQERLDILNKDKKIHSLEIIDINDNSGLDSGTRITIRLPLQD